MHWYSKSSDALIKPESFAPKDLVESKLAIIVFAGRVYNWMKESAQSNFKESNKGVFGAQKFFVTKDGLSVFHANFGAPAAVGLTEVLIAGGIKGLLVYGQAGSINPEIYFGELLIPTFTVREEGASYHYLPSDVIAKPSQSLKNEIRSLLDSMNIKYKQGGVWTTDAPFRETRDKVLNYSKRGVFAVEMECSAIFSVAKYRQAKAAALLIITDLLYGQIWRPG
ncbi:MAG: nucleoside phosphorylase, partial [Candidatus Bathyarchaeota archaeon]